MSTPETDRSLEDVITEKLGSRHYRVPEVTVEDIVDVLREADEPLTKRDLKYELHASERQVEYALQEAFDAERIERWRSEDDGRKFVYSVDMDE